MGTNWGDESADAGYPQQVSASEFKQLLCGEFVADERTNKLHERLGQYYKDTPDSMGSREAMEHYRLFKRWCNDHGYTQKEINMAKRQCVHLAI